MRITPSSATQDAPRRAVLVRRAGCPHAHAIRYYARWQEGGDLGHLRICETCGNVEGLGAAARRLRRQERRGTQERGIRLTPYRNPATAPQVVTVALSERGAELLTHV
jgi:hypothetical protein